VSTRSFTSLDSGKKDESVKYGKEYKGEKVDE
jgi:hypothetical protein